MTSGYTEREILDLFVKRAQELKQIRNDFNSQWDYKMIITDDEVTVEVPDENIWRSYMMAFRLLYADREPTQFGRVSNIAKGKVKDRDSDYLSQLQICKDKWKAAFKDGDFLTMDDESLAPKQVLDVYINGSYFHSDKRHQTALENYEQFDWRLDHVQLHRTIARLSDVIYNLAQLIMYGFDNNLFDFSEG